MDRSIPEVTGLNGKPSASEAQVSGRQHSTAPRPIVILGAGPAGLTCAYELAKGGVKSVVLERDDTVGGLARTVCHNGYRFDIGGHRFFTKVSAIEALWHEILGDDLLTRSRLSRIHYNRKFFSYPLKPVSTLVDLGPYETLRCVASYALARLNPKKPEDDFATWVSNRFGKRLFEIFFKTYTEKVWGIPCSEIHAEWAAQRIKNLSLAKAISNALFGERAKKKTEVVTTLINQFLYPRHGPGMMWERVSERLEQSGCRIAFNTPLQRVFWKTNRVHAVQAGDTMYEGDDFVSSVAIRDLVKSFEPAPPQHVVDAANRLRYRDFLTVALVLNKKDVFPDNWIYIHDPKVRMGRVQNYGNWSPEMVPDSDTTCLGLEYFCFEGDQLWNSTDEELIELGKREIATLGLADSADVIDGAIVRMPKAYPIYDRSYKQAVNTLREFVATLTNLQLIGRNGMHRYNNQDHSMLTALLAARNVLGSSYDLWQVNVEQEYHEEGKVITAREFKAMEAAQPLVPRRVAE